MRDSSKYSKKTPFKADLYHIFDEEGGNILPPFSDALLQETLFLIQQENGSKILIESLPPELGFFLHAVGQFLLRENGDKLKL